MPELPNLLVFIVPVNLVKNEDRLVVLNDAAYSAVDLDGGQGRNRTADTRIFSPLLYRLSYPTTGTRYYTVLRQISQGVFSEIAEAATYNGLALFIFLVRRYRNKTLRGIAAITEEKGLHFFF